MVDLVVVTIAQLVQGFKLFLKLLNHGLRVLQLRLDRRAVATFFQRVAERLLLLSRIHESSAERVNDVCTRALARKASAEFCARE